MDALALLCHAQPSPSLLFPSLFHHHLLLALFLFSSGPSTAEPGQLPLPSSLSCITQNICFWISLTLLLFLLRKLKKWLFRGFWEKLSSELTTSSPWWGRSVWHAAFSIHSGRCFGQFHWWPLEGPYQQSAWCLSPGCVWRRDFCGTSTRDAFPLLQASTATLFQLLKLVEVFDSSSHDMISDYMSPLLYIFFCSWKF